MGLWNPTVDKLNAQTLADMFNSVADALFAHEVGFRLPKMLQLWPYHARISKLFGTASNIWDEHGFLPPELIRFLLVEPSLDKEDVLYRNAGVNGFGEFCSLKEVLRAVEKSIPTFDRLSGFLSKQHVRLVTGMAHAYAVRTDVPTFAFSFDLTNMKGANEHFRKLYAAKEGCSVPEVDENKANALTDIAAGIITDIIDKHLLALKGKYPDARYVPMRAGGDEFSAIITGVDEGDADNALESIVNEVEETMARLGMLRFEHSKHRGDENWCGFGMGGCIDDLKLISPETYFKNVDIKTDANKVAVFALRQESDKLSILAAKSGCEFQPVLSDICVAVEEEGDDYAGYQPYVDLVTGQSLSSERAEEILNNFGNRSQEIKAELKADNAHYQRDIIDESFPFDQEDVVAAPLFVTPATEKQIKLVSFIKKHIGNLPISSGLEKIIRLVTKDLAPKDPATDCHMDTELAPMVAQYALDTEVQKEQLMTRFEEDDEPIQQVFGNIEEIEKLKPTIIGVEIQNLGTLNGLFDHHRADAVLKIIADDCIRGVLEKRVGSDKEGVVLGDWKINVKPYYDVHAGGGRFYILLPPSVENEHGNTIHIDQKMINEISSDIMDSLEWLEKDDEITLRLGLSGYLKKLEDLFNSRGKVNVTGLFSTVFHQSYEAPLNDEERKKFGGRVVFDLQRKIDESIDLRSKFAVYKCITLDSPATP